MEGTQAWDSVDDDDSSVQCVHPEDEGHRSASAQPRLPGLGAGPARGPTLTGSVVGRPGSVHAIRRAREMAATPDPSWRPAQSRGRERTVSPAPSLQEQQQARATEIMLRVMSAGSSSVNHEVLEGWDVPGGGGSVMASSYMDAVGTGVGGEGEGWGDGDGDGDGDGGSGHPSNSTGTQGLRSVPEMCDPVEGAHSCLFRFLFLPLLLLFTHTMLEYKMYRCNTVREVV